MQGEIFRDIPERLVAGDQHEVVFETKRRDEKIAQGDGYSPGFQLPPEFPGLSIPFP